MVRGWIRISIWVSFIGISQAWAQDHYFTVQEPLSPTPEVELLRFDRHEEALPKPTENYNRQEHYGAWKIIDSCFDTRAMVLQRDSQSAVQAYPHNACKIKSGKWYDHYTGKTFTKASDIQIDHVVPLKNSYISGAWKWDYKARCLFANFLAYDFHLRAVESNENQRKGDKAPDGYMPSNKKFSCQYLKNWLEIKLIWGLALTSSETSAIKRLARQNNCSAQKMRTTLDQLLKNRQAIEDNAELCQ